MSVSVITVADVVDEHDGDGAIWTKRSCQGGSWVLGECVGEMRERAEVSSVGARRCSGVPMGVSVRDLESLSGLGTS
jgi:hypothetical protein